MGETMLHLQQVMAVHWPMLQSNHMPIFSEENDYA